MIKVFNVLWKISLTGLIFLSFTANSQEMTVMDWNVLSLEKQDKSGQNGFPIDDFVEVFKKYNPDILCLNEFETGTSRVGKEKMAEIGAALGMYGYFIESYPKDKGYYGNVILSKYPIISSHSQKMIYKNHKGNGYYQFNTDSELNDYGADQRSVGYVDILFPIGNGNFKTLRIVCTHFDHKGNEEKVRGRQVGEVIKFASLAKPVYPTILCGDLNTAQPYTLDPFNKIGDHQIENWVDHIYTFPKGTFKNVNKSVFRAGNLSDHDAVIVKIKL
jgi:hypothetical protein